MLNDVMMKKSIYRNSLSVRFEPIQYRISTDPNCVRLYMQMYLKMPKDVVRAALPSLRGNRAKHLVFCI